MSRIILQPTGNEAKEHYGKTILTPVSIDTIEAHVDHAVAEKLREQYPDGKVRVWGVTSGAKNTTKKKWERMKRGDIVLFAGENRIKASAVVTMTFCNAGLARELWGEDQSGQTWENLYFVTEITDRNIPYRKINRVLGYDENYTIRRFNVLEQEASERLNAVFDLFSEDVVEEVTEQDYRNEVERLCSNDSLDSRASGTSRKEQSFLRDFLFQGKKEAVCGICGRRLPVNLLVTAHIQKRSTCTKEERLDFENIVMPMCKLGCDDLYEKGYIYLVNGQVRVNTKKKASGDLEKALDDLEGKQYTGYKESMERYFTVHRESFGIDG